MFEFIVGYALGSSNRDSTPMNGKAIAVVLLVLMALVGAGYMMLPRMFPESVPSSMAECGGSAIQASMCNLMGIATTVGMIIGGFVALVVVLIFIPGAGSSKK